MIDINLWNVLDTDVLDFEYIQDTIIQIEEYLKGVPPDLTEVHEYFIQLRMKLECMVELGKDIFVHKNYINEFIKEEIIECYNVSAYNFPFTYIDWYTLSKDVIELEYKQIGDYFYDKY